MNESTKIVVEIWEDLLEIVKKDNTFLKSIITVNEIWVYCLRTWKLKQSLHWKINVLRDPRNHISQDYVDCFLTWLFIIKSFRMVKQSIVFIILKFWDGCLKMFKETDLNIGPMPNGYYYYYYEVLAQLMRSQNKNLRWNYRLFRKTHFLLASSSRSAVETTV